ncbi:MAG: redoxin domain-containing protein [Deltaproteobacteria bacterium]|nr:redoxin domain-containing protein [Deltaproteobacteria bacterium]
MGRIRQTISLVLCLGAFGCTGSGRVAAAHPLARSPAPVVTTRLASGASFRAADAKGKVLLLDFWATWCPPCKAAFPRLDALYRKHRADGLEVVAVSEDDDDAKAAAFAKEANVTFTIAYDDDGKAAEAFAVQSMPTSYLVDRRGVVRYVHAGYHPDEADQIEAELTELLAEAP